MDINSLIAHYGYAALVIGSLAEGETITLLGGVAAHQGLLKFPLVVISVALGGMIGDQLLYLLGRRYGGKILRRFSKTSRQNPPGAENDPAPSLSVRDWHPFYVWFSRDRPVADWRKSFAA